MESDDKSSFEASPILDLQIISAENQRQIDAANSLINNSAIQAIVDKFNIDNFAKNHPLADDIENGVKELIKENNELKDALKSNNSSMKRHFTILEKLLEDTHKSHKNYKRKLDEAHHAIEELMVQNNDLKKPLQDLIRPAETKVMNDNAKLLQENHYLREKLISAQRKLQNYEQASAHDVKVSSEKEQELYHVIATLTRQIENAERARKKLSLDVDRFLGQEMKIQQLLSGGESKNVTNICYWNALFPAVIVSGQHEAQLIENLKELNKILQSDEMTFSETSQDSNLSSLNQVNDIEEEQIVERLQEQIASLRKKVAQERATCTLHRKLLEDTRSKFKDINHQCLAILKDHETKIKAFEIALAKAKEDAKDVTKLRHELSDKQNRIIQLECDLSICKKKLAEAEKKSDDFYILQNQMKLYEEDYLSERESNEILASDKLKLEKALHLLKQENAKLKKQLQASGEDELNNLTTSESAVNTVQYICINETCGKPFPSEEELQNHIYSCLDLKD